MRWIPLSMWRASAPMLSIDVAAVERPRSILPLTLGEWAALTGLSAVALGLRLFRLERSELWFDEAFAALVAMEPARTLLSEVAADSSPPLYFLLLRGYSLLLSADASTLRVLSVVCGVLGVWATFIAGCRLWSAGAGLASAALLAVSPLHVYYSREVRPYALLVVLVLASIIALFAIADGRRGSVAAYCVATSAAIWTHNYGLFLLVVLGVWVVVRRLPAPTAITAAIIVGAGYLPWLPVLVRQTTSGATRWVERLWLETPPPLVPLLSLAGFSIGGRTPPYVPTGSDALPGWLHGVAYGLFGLLVLSALAHERAREARQVTLVGVVLLGVPISLSFVMPIFLVGRHDVIVLPLFLLLAGRGLTVIGRRQAAAAWLVVLLLGAAATYRYHSLPAVHAARRHAALLLKHAEPGDATLATGFTRNGVEYGVRERGRTMAFHSFPTSFGAHRGWVDERELANRAFLEDDADRLAARIQKTLGDDRLLWILHSRDLAAANELLMRRVDRSFRQVPCPGDAEDDGITCWRRRSP